MVTDFQKVADAVEAATSVMSVQVLEDGSMGELRIVAGNKAYIDAIEKPAGDYSMRSDKFIPGSIYTDYVPRDLNFEDYCFRSAVQKKCLHSYVKPSNMPVWFNMTFLPLGPSEGNIHYCTYTMEVNFRADTRHMSDIDPELASAVLETCIKLRGTGNFQAAMQEVIKDIRQLCKAEQTCILLTDGYEKTTSVLCTDFAENSSVVAPDGDIPRPGMPGFYEIAEKWEELIGSSNCIIAKDERDMELVKERDPEWYESMKASGARNIVLFPLKSQDELLGYIWAVNFAAEKTPEIKDTLELTTFILGSEINNHLLLDRLKILSSRDMLTGVLNRNEMNNLVEKMSRGEADAGSSIGVIFLDLNGLKSINDELGHGRGDALLRDAARAIQEIYPADRIFRAGGDEFVIMLPGVSGDELLKGIEELRRVSEGYERVSFAIGGCVEPDSRDVREALKIADMRMYEDKRDYYVKHPEMKKRL